jgi:repressor LexA
MGNDNKQSKIATFYQKHKRLPEYRELMDIFGFKSRNAVFKLIKRLVENGTLKKDKQGRISPAKLFGEIRVLGYVEAGFPSPAEEELQDTITLDEWLIENKEATYMLKVKGDSMIDAGIMPGDMVLVERGREPKNGDVVVAEVDGAWTIKHFNKTGKVVTLIPANKKYKTIIPKNELKIAAVAISVIRKF